MSSFNSLQLHFAFKLQLFTAATDCHRSEHLITCCHRLSVGHCRSRKADGRAVLFFFFLSFLGSRLCNLQYTPVTTTENVCSELRVKEERKRETGSESERDTIGQIQSTPTSTLYRLPACHPAPAVVHFALFFLVPARRAHCLGYPHTHWANRLLSSEIVVSNEPH